MNGSANVLGAGPLRRLPLLLAAAAVAVALAGGPVRAQAPADGHWLPWLGCWEVTGGPATPGGGGLCIHANAGAPGVSFAALSGGKVISEHAVVADGARRPVTEEGCQGWESAKWSSDGRRLLRRTELDCGGTRRVVSGVLMMLPDDRWADIEAAGVPGSDVGVQVVHYRPMPFTTATATGLLPRGQDLAIRTSRTAAAAPLQLGDVIDASRQLDARVVQAMVYERRNGYPLDSRALVRLAEARVPTDVIDLMVALSYPDFFSIGGPAGRLALRSDSTPRGGRGGGGGGGWYPGWGCYSYGGLYGSPYWWMSGYRYGYGVYPATYGYDPCYGPYGGGYGGGYWGGGYWGYPSGGVVIVKNGDRGGKMVKGGGYQPGSGGSGRSAHPRGNGGYSGQGQGSSGSTAQPSTGRSAGSSGSSSSGSSSSGSSGSSSSGSSGRTAHPKP